MFSHVRSALLWRSSSQAARYALVAIPGCLLLLFWHIHPTLLLDSGDSAAYLANSPWRTATYPLFLDVFYGRGLLAVQLLLFMIALSWLALFSSRLLPWLVSAALVLMIGANPYVWELQATVMTEALTTPLQVVLVGCLLGYAWAGRSSYALAAALICGVATTIRPPMIALLVAPLIIVWLTPTERRKARLTLLVVLVWTAPVVVERLYSHWTYGPRLTSPMGRNLFMKAAMIDAPPTRSISDDPLDQRLAQALNVDFAPVRGLIAKTPDRDIRYILLTNYESCAGYPCADAVLSGFHRNQAETDQHMVQIAVARLRSNPLAYLKLAASEYPRMWLLHQRKDPLIAPKYNAFLARQSPLPFQAELAEYGQPTPQWQQTRTLHLQRIVFAAVGLVALLATLGLAFRFYSPASRTAFSILLGGQAVLIFSTFFGVGLVRYAMGLWPAIIAGVVLGLADLLGRRNPERASRSSPRQRPQ